MGLQLANILTIPQLIIGGLCVTVLVFLNIYGTYPLEMNVLYFQMACGSAGSTNILLGLESILFLPRERLGIRNTIIFDIIVSTLFGTLLILSALNFGATYREDMEDEEELWDENVLKYYEICYLLGLVAGGICFATVFFLAFLLYKHISQK